MKELDNLPDHNHHHRIMLSISACCCSCVDGRKTKAREDVKELYYYLDNLPDHSYVLCLC